MKLKAYLTMLLILMLTAAAIYAAEPEKSIGAKAGEAAGGFVVGSLSSLFQGIKGAYDAVTNDPSLQKQKSNLEYIFNSEVRRQTDLQGTLKTTNELLTEANTLLSDINSATVQSKKKTKYATPEQRAKSDLDYIFGK